MRIANKMSLAKLSSSTAHAALIGFVLLATLTSADAANPPSPVMPMAMPAPVSAAPAAMPGVPMPMAMPAPASNDMAKNITAMEDKATDGAKNTIRSLDSTDTLTLDDLNHARQTVARIDAMIDVEKRLGELQKLRDARNGGSASSFAGAIPASALSPAGGRFGNGGGVNLAPSLPIQPIPVMMHAPSSSGGEISRIVGSDGKYVAVIKTDGGTRTVRVGDNLNGGTVRWITSSALGIDEKGQTHILHVKNVDLVTSAMR